MKNLFAYDGPLMKILNDLFNQACLNILTILCLLPVITAGAGFTAAHVTSIALRNGKHGVAQIFFTAFKENFKKSTLLWVLYLLVFALVILGFQACGMIDRTIFIILRVVLLLEGVMLLLTLVWIFPLMARYDNAVRYTITNALIMTMGRIFPTLLMAIVYLIPLTLFVLMPSLMPFLLCFCFSWPIHACGYRCVKALIKVEEQAEEDTEQ